MRYRLMNQLAVLLAAALLAGQTGCSFFGSKDRTAQAVAAVRVRLVYQINPTKFASEDPVDPAKINHHTQAANDILTRSRVGEVTVQYPHPFNVPGFALVNLRTWQGPAESPMDFVTDSFDAEIDRAPHEYVIEITKSEVDDLVRELNDHGFYQRFKHHSAQSKMTVSVDGQSNDRRWSREPAFDELIVRARYEGTEVTAGVQEAVARRAASMRKPQGQGPMLARAPAYPQYPAPGQYPQGQVAPPQGQYAAGQYPPQYPTAPMPAPYHGAPGVPGSVPIQGGQPVMYPGQALPMERLPPIPYAAGY